MIYFGIIIALVWLMSMRYVMRRLADHERRLRKTIRRQRDILKLIDMTNGRITVLRLAQMCERQADFWKKQSQTPVPTPKDMN